ncbi:hypothetical protein DEI93_16260 (plasmid) [Curtobacterium sp. MCBD17_035]|uniref:hypothetical protein n=1 Tax=Curtobacterium sp. MCBD17_035 TaxID=2175673 RepID=UPI000DAACE83|nr:hypothetical protein [Curtobacterium sp. MCBD17_035]WIB69180.1 hypothetical protein DEI93_16260 [Curtobacterium sp. MCBD17_035]
MVEIPLALAAALFILRTPIAWRRRAARPAWLTTGYGLLSFLTLGTVIPSSMFDGVLGGRNLLALVQTLTAAAAIWYLRDAMLIHARSTARGARWALAILLATQTAAFFAIPAHSHGSSPVTFLHDSFPTVAGWVFITVYQGMILGLSLDSLRILRGDRRADAVLFRIGHALMALGATSELLGAWTWHFHGHNSPISTVAFAGFQGLFYPGTMFIAAAYLLLGGRKILRDAPWQVRRRYLRHLLAVNGIRAGTRPHARGDDLLATYEVFIDVNNHLTTGDLALNAQQHRRLEHIGTAIDAHSSNTLSGAAR